MKRFEPIHSGLGDCWADMEERPQGTYVLHSDFEKVVKALKFYQDELGITIEGVPDEIRDDVSLYEELDDGPEPFGFTSRETLKELGVE